MFVTAADVKSRFQVIASQCDITVTDDEEALISARTTDAYNLILAHLAKRDYLKADVDQWAAGSAYQMDMALYLILRDTLAGGGQEEALLDRYDREGELEDVVLLDSSGSVISPSGGGSFAVVDFES